MPPEIGMARARARGALDRFEQEEQAFFERVRQGYLDRAARFPDRYIVVDAAQDLSGVQKSIEAVMSNWFVDE
jgi:dTMP kinase